MLMQRAARWRPATRRRAGHAITTTVRHPMLRFLVNELHAPLTQPIVFEAREAFL